MQPLTELENIFLGSLWIDKKIPPLEYCSFERGARLLGCEIDDLLHLHDIGAFNIALKLDGLAVKFTVEFEDASKKLDADTIHPILTNKTLEMESSTIIYNLNDDSIFNFENGFHIKGFACGVWYTDFILPELKNGLIIEPEFEATLKPVKVRDDVSRALALYEGNTDVEVPFEDLLIMRRDLELIWKSVKTGKPLPGILTGKILSTPKASKPISNTAEHHARNREGLLNAAIFILSKYPDECRGSRKEISPEKWTNSIIKHLDELPPVFITNEQEILRKLRLAVNHAGLKRKG